MLDTTLSTIIEDAGCMFTAMLFKERISEAVKAAEAKGHSISKIAELCGITRQSIYQWMDGSTASIDGTNLVIISELSGCNARWIIIGNGPKTFSDDPPLTRATPQQLTAELMRRLSPDEIQYENSGVVNTPKGQASI